MHNTIKQLRLNSKLKPIQAAKSLEISLGHLYKIERYKRIPSFSVIKKMVVLYNCSIQKVFLSLDPTLSYESDKILKELKKILKELNT